MYRWRPNLQFVSALVLFMLGLARSAAAGPPAPPGRAVVRDLGAHIVFLPAIELPPAWRSPLGFELAGNALHSDVLAAPARALGAGWVRLNILSWRDVQPEQSAPYNWQAPSVQLLERELLAAAALGLNPIVVVDDSPRWATQAATACGALRADTFAAFGQFMAALAERYSRPPHNVRHWELGNEPDVDPSLVPPDNMYGCWGQISDPYYGGEHYGAMLKVVTPAIKAADPAAQVLVGGLLLNHSNITTPGRGKPERFLEGILRALQPDIDPYFDAVAYHAYAAWAGPQQDDSGLDNNAAWRGYGGLAHGKAAFLRQVLEQYGVAKPLFLDETALLCWPGSESCQAETAHMPLRLQQFLESQSTFALRMPVRSLAAGAQVIVWYTMDGPGWRNAALLDAAAQPRPVFDVYRGLGAQIRDTQLPPTPLQAYGAGVEAYRFTGAQHVVDVLWSRDTVPDTVSIPEQQFISAYGRAGQPLDAALLRRRNGMVELAIGFGGGYVHRRR